MKEIAVFRDKRGKLTGKQITNIMLWMAFFILVATAIILLINRLTG